jgi:hypothetical protein
VELVGRAVLCPPCDIGMIGAHGSGAPTAERPIAPWTAANFGFALSLACGNEVPN